MSTTHDLIKAVTGIDPINWLTDQGATKKNPTDALNEVLTANGYWKGNRTDSIIYWLQSVTGLTTRDINVLKANAALNGIYVLAKTFGEIAQWFYPGFTIDENGQGLSLVSPYYPIQIKTPIPVLNGTTMYGTVTVQANQWNNFEKGFSIKIDSTGTGNDKIAPLRETSGDTQGFHEWYDHTASLLKIAVVKDASNYIQQFYTISEDVKHDVYYTFNGTTLNVYIDGSLASIDSTDNNGTVTSFTVPTTMVVGANESTSTEFFKGQIFDLYCGAIGQTYDSWSMQEGNGNLSFNKVLDGKPIKWAVVPTWTTTTECSHESSRKGLSKGTYFDGTNDWVLTGGVLSTIIASVTEVRIVAYFSISSIVGSPIVFSFDDGADGLLNVGVASSNGKVFFFVPGGLLSTQFGSTTVLFDQINKVEMVLDVANDTGSIYLNDVVEIDTVSFTEDTLVNILSGLTRLTLGQELDTGTPSNFLGGVVHLSSIKADSVEIIDSVTYTRQNGALPIDIPTNEANAKQNCFGVLHGKVLSKLNSSLIRVDFDPDSEAVLTLLPNNYQKGDSFAMNYADKKVNGDAEEKFLFDNVNADYQGEDGYTVYMADE